MKVYLNYFLISIRMGSQIVETSRLRLPGCKERIAGWKVKEFNERSPME